MEVVGFDVVKDLSRYQCIVYFGRLYAGGVKGLKATVKRLLETVNLIVVTVGLTDPSDPKNQGNIRESLCRQLPEELYRKTNFFHLSGGINYEKLSFKYKTMMALLYQSIKKLPAEKRSEEDRAIIETYGQKINFMNYETLNPIVKSIK